MKILSFTFREIYCSLKAITGNLNETNGEYLRESEIHKLNQGQLQLENRLKIHMSLTSTVIKNFRETAKKLNRRTGIQREPKQNSPTHRQTCGYCGT